MFISQGDWRLEGLETLLERRPGRSTPRGAGPVCEEAATKMLEEIFRAHPRTADVVVTFNKFLDSSLNIQVLHWWQGTDAKLNMADLQDLNLEVKRRFDAERIEFAFPTQTVLHRPVTGP